MSRNQKVVIKDKKQSIIETENETEYCRASESKRMLDKSFQKLNNLREQLIIEKRKINALDKVIKEIVDEKKGYKLELDMTKQELDHFKNRNNIKMSNSINEHAIMNFFKEGDERIIQESLQGVDQLAEKYRQLYK